MSGRCTLVCCAFDRERANRAPGRRSLTPLYSPAAATRDAAVGGSTSSAASPGEGATEPSVMGPGSTAALGSSPAKGERSAGYPTGRDVARGVANVPAAQLPKTPPRRSPFLSVRMRWWDDFLDDLIQAFGITTLALLTLLIGFVIAVRVFGGAA